MSFDAAFTIVFLVFALAGCTVSVIQATMREGLVQRFIVDFPEDPSHRSFFLSRKQKQWKAIQSQLRSLPAAYQDRYREIRRMWWLAWGLVALLAVFAIAGKALETSEPAPAPAIDCPTPAAPK